MSKTIDFLSWEDYTKKLETISNEAFKKDITKQNMLNSHDTNN